MRGVGLLESRLERGTSPLERETGTNQHEREMRIVCWSPMTATSPKGRGMRRIVTQVLFQLWIFTFTGSGISRHWRLRLASGTEGQTSVAVDVGQLDET